MSTDLLGSVPPADCPHTEVLLSAWRLSASGQAVSRDRVCLSCGTWLETESYTRAAWQAKFGVDADNGPGVESSP